MSAGSLVNFSNQIGEMSKSTVQSAFSSEQDTEDSAWSAEEFLKAVEKESDERATPTWLIALLHAALGGLFDLDPCSGAEPEDAPIATTRFTKETNGLLQSWLGYETIYVNPPYSDLASWLAKIATEMSKSDPDSPELVLCLLPSYASSSEAFQNYARKASYISFIDGRLTFQGQDKQAPFSSLLVVFGDLDEESDLARTLDDCGTLYSRAEIATAQENGELQKLLTDGGTTVMPPVSSSPSAPQSTAGSLPKAVDVSSDAPSVPQGKINFRNVCIDDRLYISFDDATFGFPAEFPPEANFEVLSGASEVSPDTTPRGWDTLTGYDTITDTWISISQNPEDHSETRCSLTVDGRNWIDVSICKICRWTANTVPAIDPYGEGTSYVC